MCSISFILNVPFATKLKKNALKDPLYLHLVSFRNTISEKEVTVAVTPNGYADGIAIKDGKEYFVMPEEKLLKMGDFLNKLDDKRFVCSTFLLFKF